MSIENFALQFFETSNLNDLPELIKQKSNVNDQIQEYDQIYDFAFQNGLTRQTDLIPGLNKRLEFIIYSEYFNKKIFGKNPNEECINALIQLLQNIVSNEISMQTFLECILEIKNILRGERFSEIKLQNCSNISYVYPVFGFASLTKRLDMIFGNCNYSKLFLCLNSDLLMRLDIVKINKFNQKMSSHNFNDFFQCFHSLDSSNGSDRSVDSESLLYKIKKSFIFNSLFSDKDAWSVENLRKLQNIQSIEEINKLDCLLEIFSVFSHELLTCDYLWLKHSFCFKMNALLTSLLHYEKMSDLEREKIEEKFYDLLISEHRKSNVINEKREIVEMEYHPDEHRFRLTPQYIEVSYP